MEYLQKEGYKINRYEILKSEAKKKANGAKVKDYVVGIGLCAVLLNDQRVGSAYTARDMIPWGCSLYDDLPKTDAPVEEFIDMFDNDDVVLKALGMSAINACLNQGNFEKMDIMEKLKLDSSSVVGMIGDFTPMIDPIREKAKMLYVFEKQNLPDTVPTEKIPELLPLCDVVLISATTLLNGTYDSIIQHATTDEIFMLGPSTPICPKALPEIKAFGATIVNEGALRTLYHGGGTRNLYREKTGRKVVFIAK